MNIEKSYEVTETLMPDFTPGSDQNSSANSLLMDDNFRIVNFNGEFNATFFEIFGIILRPGDHFIDGIDEVHRQAGLLWRRQLSNLKEECHLIFNGSHDNDWGVYSYEVILNHFAVNGSGLISVYLSSISFRKATGLKHKSVSNLRSFLNAMENGVCMTNRHHEIIEFNCKFENLFKDLFEIHVVQGNNLLDYIPENIRERWLGRFANGFSGEAHYYTDYYKAKRGQVVLEFKVYPLYENGILSRLAISTLDITKIKESEIQMKIKNEELVKVNKEIDKFVYSTSHDLRSPLTSIKGLINILRIDDKPETISQCLPLIESSIDKLDVLISNIVYF
jgi:PAS domain S-box-containing protein